MVLFAVGDVVWQAAIAGCVTVVLAWMSQRAKKSADDAAKEVKEVAVKADNVAVKVEEVKRIQGEESTKTTNTLAEIKKDVNSGSERMAKELKEAREDLLRVSKLLAQKDSQGPSEQKTLTVETIETGKIEVKE